MQPEGLPTVLVVEDEPIIREIVCEVLEEAGFAVLSAPSAETAVALLERGPPVLAAFLDIDLGDLGGGYGVGRQVRRVCPGAAVIYTSGGPQENFRRERVADSLFVPKPYRPAEIVSLVQALVFGAAAA